jgi:predicted ATPase
MIESITFQPENKINNGPLLYSKNIKVIAGQTFEFKPGLNIIIGPNGSGKSTLLSAIAYSMAAKQGGISTVTSDWLYEMKPDKKTGFPFSVKHDGQAVRYIDPRESMGLIGGMAAFDFDFIEKGIANATFKGSSGQKTLMRVDETLREIVDNTPPPDINYKIILKHYSEYESTFNLLKPSIPKGQRTFLLDEPDSNLSIPLQHRLWNFFCDKKRYGDKQIIIVSHSPFCLDVPDANYITTEKNYRRDSLSSLYQYFTGIFKEISHDESRH